MTACHKDKKPQNYPSAFDQFGFCKILRGDSFYTEFLLEFPFTVFLFQISYLFVFDETKISNYKKSHTHGTSIY